MGQEESKLIDDSVPPGRLESRSAKAVAKYINDGKAKSIVVMTGAGISTSAGIPDFRSPETGLYANLAKLNLPYAEAVFDISYFRKNPEPFYALAHELYPGKYRPTITHSFVSLLHEKGLLLKLFTQNIDCLEREAGVPDELVVEAHGSFATQRCIECHVEFPDDDMKQAIEQKEVPRCIKCAGLVKPDIVFFGESLPPKFFNNRTAIPQADLCLIMGTSLQVHPFAALPQFISEGVPRLLINLEQVGGIGSRPDDVLLLGDCDEKVRELATELGWLEELEAEWAKTAPKQAAELGKKKAAQTEAEKAKTKDEKLEAEVDKLTKEIDDALKIGQDKRKFATGDIEKILQQKYEQIQLGKEGGPRANPTVVRSPEMANEETEKKQAEQKSKEEDGGGGLNHVFGHTKGKPSL